MKKKSTLVVLVLFAVVASAYYFWVESAQAPGGVVACTMEAKLCPDGSAVGRTGPHCAFAACPGEEQTNKFSASPTSGTAPLAVTFSYPFSQYKYAPVVGFGDGTEANISCTRSGCTASHTYTKAGTYTAQLVQRLCPPNAEGCLAPEEIVGSVTIMVR